MRKTANGPACNRVRHPGMLWVLAMLALRALVPAGFMLAPEAGHLALVPCDVDARRAAGHHHEGPQHPLHAHPDPTCPYAQSAGPAPLPALPVLAAAPISTVRLLPAQSPQTFVPFGPSRQQSPRAPPRLA